MIQVKNTEVKLRGRDVDLAIECSVLMRLLYRTNPAVFAEVIKSISKEVEANGKLQYRSEAGRDTDAVL